MNRFRLASVLLALDACAPRPESPASGQSPSDSVISRSLLFREIDIEPFGKVALGAPFTQHSAPVVPLPDGLLALEPGAGRFANTDSILVRVDAENRVRAIYFVYQAGTDFAAAVSDYTGSLGTPMTRTVTDSGGGRLDRAVWEDAQTHFELTNFISPSRQPRVASAMLDRGTPR